MVTRKQLELLQEQFQTGVTVAKALQYFSSAEQKGKEVKARKMKERIKKPKQPKVNSPPDWYAMAVIHDRGRVYKRSMAGAADREKLRAQRRERSNKERLHRIVAKWWRCRKAIEARWDEAVKTNDVVNMCRITALTRTGNKNNKIARVVKALAADIKAWLLGYASSPDTWKFSARKVLLLICKQILRASSPNKLLQGMAVGVFLKVLSLLSKRERAFCISLAPDVLAALRDVVFKVAGVNQVLLKAAKQVALLYLSLDSGSFVRFLACDGNLFLLQWDELGDNYLEHEKGIFALNHMKDLDTATVAEGLTAVECVYCTATCFLLFDGAFKEDAALLGPLLSGYPPRSVLNGVFTDNKQVEASMYELYLGKKLCPKYDMFYDYTKASLPPPPLTKQQKRANRDKRRKERDAQNTLQREVKEENEKQAVLRQKTLEQETAAREHAFLQERQAMQEQQNYERVAIADNEHREFLKIDKNEVWMQVKKKYNEQRAAMERHALRVSAVKKAEYKARCRVREAEETALQPLLALREKELARMSRSATKQLNSLRPDEASYRANIVSNEKQEAARLFVDSEATFRCILECREEVSRKALYHKMLDSYFWIPVATLIRYERSINMLSW